MELAALEKLMHDCSLLECLGLAPLDKQVHYSVDLEPEAVNKLAKRVQLRPALIGGMEYRKVKPQPRDSPCLDLEQGLPYHNGQGTL